MRPLSLGDLSPLTEILSDPEVMKHSVRGVCDEAATRQFIEWCLASVLLHAWRYFQRAAAAEFAKDSFRAKAALPGGKHANYPPSGLPLCIFTPISKFRRSAALALLAAISTNPREFSYQKASPSGTSLKVRAQ